MQQHPIPQNISQYEFHLIGNMTIKQFIELGAGVGVAVIFYALPLPPFLKWPLIIFSFMVGAALAFLPFDGRPLDRMVVVFFKAVYSPTQYIWRKNPEPPSFFAFTPRQEKPKSQTELDRLRVRKNMGEYLQSLPNEGNQPELSSRESAYITSLNSQFGSTLQSSVTQKETTVEAKTAPKVRVRKMKKPENIHTDPQKLNRSIQSNVMHVPEVESVSVQTQTQQQISETNTPPPPSSNQQVFSDTMAQGNQTQTVQATHNQDLPFPKLPTTPNTIVGMILDSQGKIVENAIIEVRDKNHMPIRALKSNKLGQFFSATQLANGKYEIEVEKEGLKFEVLSLKLKGKIVEPLEIRAKA